MGSICLKRESPACELKDHGAPLGRARMQVPDRLLGDPRHGPRAHLHDLYKGGQGHEDARLQGYLAHKIRKHPPPQDPPRTLGIGLL